MSTEAGCTFKVTSWDEKPYQEFEFDKLIRSICTLRYLRECGQPN